MFLFWSHSCKRILVDNKLDDFNHELLVIFTNTNISNDTNFEPTALLLELNLYSVDSFDSCSFQHLLELLRTRIFRITRILSLWLFSLSLIYIR